ncbi:hypothetical protein [Priestia koreensis]|nr:hypothetical protein [Priestia koreensis]
MALTDLPTVKTPPGSAFLIALPIIVFVFFFTQFKSADVAS